MNPNTVVAVLTAAGRSSRMGRPKALLEWNGKTLIQHQIEALAGFAEVIVVLGHNANGIRPFVPTPPRVRVLENLNYDMGRTSSLALGFSAIGGHPEGVLVVAVDQPLAAHALTELLYKHRPDSPISQPTFAGKRGHPVLFRGDLLPELKAIGTSPEGLRSVVAKYREWRQEVPVTDSEVLLDLNAPEDYEGRAQTGPLSAL